MEFIKSKEKMSSAGLSLLSLQQTFIPKAKLTLGVVHEQTRTHLIDLMASASLNTVDPVYSKQ
jgi:hypothetical protein